MARSRVVRRAREAKLPEGVRAGQRMPGGPLIYLAERAEPNVVLLKRWTIGWGPTEHPRVERDVRRSARSENPYAGRSGWTLYAMGPKAERERGLKGPDAASRLRHWFVRIPQEHRISLRPVGFVPPGDPLRAPGNQFRQWVGDECIVSLIRAGAQGAGDVKPLRFAVMPKQSVLIPETRQRVDIYPIAELARVFAADNTCRLEAPHGVTLKAAANALGFADLRKPLSTAPENVYEAWRSRSARADPQQRLLLNVAYHRILLHRFLQRRRLTPKLIGSKRRKQISDSVERRAALTQAYRVFVFDRRGCPVGLNVPLLEANNLTVTGPKGLINRKVPHAGFTRSDQKRVREFGAWLFTDVLHKAITECKPESISGLAELLAVADQLR